MFSDLSCRLPKSFNRMRYFCTFTDQYSRFTHVARVQNRSDIEYLFQSYKKLAHIIKYYPKGVQRLHTYCDDEYENAGPGEHTETCPDIPQHNSYPECMNRTLVKPCRDMLEQAGLGAKYWEYVIEHAI